ncbi:MAG: mitochondrial fission ELM1 family protein [Alphaproteobacteria bacterium]|nr:mitochondrial fission ELM1 family protein [Alphaproteobacteria bacterium]
MSNKSQVTCWVVTEGKAGMENQCLGLAASLGLQPVVKRIRLRSPWRQLSPFLRLGLRFSFSSKGDPISPPWPDIIIASGRSGATAAMYVRNITMHMGDKARTFAVQIQNPVVEASHFDLLAVPRHDGLVGSRVITTRGSLHRVTPEMLCSEAEKFAPLFECLHLPRIAVVIGGSNSVYQLTPTEMKPLTEKLKALVKSTGGSLMVTPSRRTGKDNLAVLQEGLKDVPSYIWNMEGENPYYGMLGIADAIVVTGDSVNMVSEACSTGKPVYVVELAGGSEKFRLFHQTLRDDGFTRPFTGALEKWSYQPLNDVQLVANRVREIMGSRLP